MDSRDRALVGRLKRGEPAAFDEAYAHLRPRVFSFLLRLTRRRDLAEDLHQETWIRLATNAARLDDDTDLAAWLFTVARNLFVSQRRWMVLDRNRLAELGLWPRGDVVESPLERAAANETERRLEAALGALPTAYREVVLLVAVERLEPARAAAVLGLRPDAFRQRLARARGMLAERLELHSQDKTRRPGEKGAA